jgi:hypothetical protein
MTTPDAYAPAPTVAVPADRSRALASAVAVYLGGYLILLAFSSQIALALSSLGNLPPTYTALLLAQLIFAVVVVVVGLFLAPASAGRKVIASAIVVAGVVIALVSVILRVTGGFAGAGVPVSLTVANTTFMTVLAVGAGWLIVRSATAGWLALLLALVLVPLPYVFALSGLESALIQFIALGVAAAIGAVIIWAGRPLRRA